jgi:GMP synthase (glutamine-hydrolysing)
VRLLVVDVNVTSGGSTGCHAIGERLLALAPDADVVHAHWRVYEPTAGFGAWAPDAIVLGPNGTPFPAYPPTFKGFLRWVRGHSGPLLGICGGHQVLALAHGAEVAPVHDVQPATTSYDGMAKQTGPARMTVEDPGHPLLHGLPAEFSLTASHVDEVKALPPMFDRLARGEPCHIQIMGHPTRPQFGIQCHPERPAGGDCGAALLRNWLGLVRGSI